MNSKQLIERHYTDTAQVWRLGGAANAWGKSDDQIFALSSTITGKLQARTGDKGVANAKDEYITSHIFYTAPASDVQQEDQIRIGGDKYKVTFSQPTAGITNFVRHQEVGLTFIENIQV